MRVFDYLVEEKINEYYELNKYQDDGKREYKQAYIDACLTLMQTEFDVNEKDEDGYTILMEIVWTGRLDIVRALVEAGADVNAVAIGDGFALEIAARFGWQKIYDYLAPLTSPKLREIAAKELPKGLIYRQRENNKPVKHFIEAAAKGNLEQVKQTIKNGVDIKAMVSHGYTALNVACWNGKISVIIALLAAGANPNIKDEDCRVYTSLMNVIDTFYDTVDTKKKLEIVQILIQAGADVNATDNYGNSVLMFSTAKTRGNDITVLLIDAGADVNAPDPDGGTVLIRAIRGWVIEKIKLLLEAGANIDLRDKKGKTALMYAIEDSENLEKLKKLQLEKIKLLIQAGTDINIRDNQGNTALSLAKKTGNAEIIQILIKAGAKED